MTSTPGVWSAVVFTVPSQTADFANGRAIAAGDTGGNSHYRLWRHSFAADARDYIDAGAVAVQVDTATWAQPRMLERIARDLGGWIATRHKDALLDEWNPDMGQTEAMERRSSQPDAGPDLRPSRKR